MFYYKFIFMLLFTFIGYMDIALLDFDLSTAPIRIDVDDVERQKYVESLMNTHTYYGNDKIGFWIGPADHSTVNLVRVGTVWFYLGLIALHFALKKIDIIYI